MPNADKWQLQNYFKMSTSKANTGSCKLHAYLCNSNCDSSHAAYFNQLVITVRFFLMLSSKPCQHISA